MAIATLATEAKATALIAECRRCLKLGVSLQGQYLKDVIDQLESATVNDLSGRTNIAPDSAVDGRDTAEKVISVT
jgi:hypothetical protein